ncbi:MAG: alpha/beta fold hydrolase [Anaerolineales bacterium]
MNKVTIHGITLAYIRCGKGTPLMLVHGYPLDHTIWDKVVPLLENDFDLILPDLRGFGESQVVETEYSLTDMADDLAALLDHLGIQQTCLAGHSMGGYIALAFARVWPRRLRGLGLVASQAIADTPERRQGRYETASAILRDGVRQVAEEMSRKLTPDVHAQVFVQKVIAAQSPVGLAGALRAMARRENAMPFLSSFRLPLVIVHGDADVLVPVERAHEIKAALPQAHLVELHGGGHMPMLEAPQVTAQALKALQ